ncbi:MAG: hypothetical protein K2M12_10015 [Muribaculaceae bacterium]|nr:hypothetical protein [Muribaculaceae bacterium]
MKKFYTLLLAASVAASAVAAPATRFNATNFAVGDAEKALVKRPDFAKKAKAQSVKLTKINASEMTDSKTLKAPAKAAPTNINELVGIYDYEILMVTGEAQGTTQSGNLDIAKGEGENEVIINGLRYSDVSIKGTVDFATGTITIKPQVLVEIPEDPENPGVSQNVFLLTYNDDWSAEDRTSNMYLHLEADGTITSYDLFVYAVEGMPGYLYTAFAYPEFAPSELNTYVFCEEYDTDEDYNFLTTYSEFTTYAKAEYYTEYLVSDGKGGAEDLGEVVGLSDFICTSYNYSFISESYEVPVIVERDFGTVYVDMFQWFYGKIGNDEYVGAPVAVNNYQISDGIEGTFSENVISWETDWSPYLINAKTGAGGGVLTLFKGCTIQLPFNVENPGAGIKDVTVDNDSNAPVEYYNIQGIRINEPAAGQLVIRRQGKNVSKVLVK